MSELESKVATLEKELDEARKSAVPIEIRTPLVRSRADLERAFSETLKVSFTEARDGEIRAAQFGGLVSLKLWGTEERLDAATLVGPLGAPDTVKVLSLLLVALVPKWNESERAEWFAQAARTATHDMSVGTVQQDVKIQVIKSNLGSDVSFCIVSFEPYTYHKALPTTNSK